MPLAWNLGTLTSWNPLVHSGPVTGLLYLSLNAGKNMKFKQSSLFTFSRICSWRAVFPPVYSCSNKWMYDRQSPTLRANHNASMWTLLCYATSHTFLSAMINKQGFQGDDTHYLKSDVWLTVHRNSAWIRETQLDVTFCILYFSSNSCSTCFGQPCAHHQELTTAWCYSLVLVCGVAAGRWSSPVGR